jgi:hypothetical protein
LPLSPKQLALHLRLPSEPEWEFAARGGQSVQPDTFDQPTPYPQELNLFEWCFDPSGRGAQPSGTLQPNALGLYDMLGNVAELVDKRYQLEYVQGRIGGHVLRGGSFRTDPTQVRASLRQEVPPCFADGKAYRSDFAGLRLAIGRAVFSDLGAAARMEEAWPTYARTRLVPKPSLPSVAPKSDVAARESEEMVGMLDDMLQQASIAVNSGQKASNKLVLLKTTLQSMQTRLAQSQQLQIETMVKMLSFSSAKVRDCTTDLLVWTTIDGLEPAVKATKVRFLNAELSSLESTLRDCAAALAEQPKDAVRGTFDQYTTSLLDQSRQNPDLESQARCTTIARDQVTDYSRRRSLDIARWRALLEAEGHRRKAQSK